MTFARRKYKQKTKDMESKSEREQARVKVLTKNDLLSYFQKCKKMHLKDVNQTTRMSRGLQIKNV